MSSSRRQSKQASNAETVALLRTRIDMLEARVGAQGRALEALQDISLALTSPQDPDRLLHLVLSRASSLLNADRATLFLYDEASGQLRSQLAQGGCEQAICLRVGQGIAGMVLQSGKAIRVANAYCDSRFSRKWDEQTGYCTRSSMAVPMKNHANATVGVLQVLNKQNGDAFHEDDEALLALLASQAAIFLDNVKLHVATLGANRKLAQLSRKLRRKVQSLDFLLALESAMTRAGKLDKLARILLQSMVQVTRSSVAVLVVNNESDNPYHAFAVYRSDLQQLQKLTGVGADRELLKVMQQRKPKRCIIKPGSRMAKDFSQIGLDVGKMLAVPMMQHDGDVFGLIAVFDPVLDPMLNKEGVADFSSDDEELLQLVASGASTDIRLLWSRQAQQDSDRLSTIGRLLSSVLHDMKTPMAVISGYVQMLVDSHESAERKQFSKLVLDQLDYITAMQREVLAFAKGERTLLVSKVYLETFMHEFEQRLRKSLEGHNVKLDVQLLDRGVARFDQVKIMRALNNLSQNAIEAMATCGGILRIVVRRRNGQLEFQVSDTGPGVPDRIREDLFSQFVTADKAEGSGLGLAIVKKIMHEHGGSVTMRSSRKGAEFTLYLPQ